MHSTQEIIFRKKNMHQILNVENLEISFETEEKKVEAVKNISFHLNQGETLAIVGESGAGKSVAAQSILKLLPENNTNIKGRILFHGKDLAVADDEYLRSIRGKKISFIFQEPGASLNPLHTIEKQIGEIIEIHRKKQEKNIRKEIIRLLDLVGIEKPETRLKSYPHQLSGGQKQRVMIAMAIANNPEILVADEPTTALDVRIQAQVLKLIKKLQKKLSMSVILITHDLEIVKNFADRVCVMRHGEILETGSSRDIFKSPENTYTKKLVSIGSDFTLPKTPETEENILEVENLNVNFLIKKSLFKKNTKYFNAVKNLSLKIKKGDSLGIVGESGSGKSSFAMAVLRLIKSTGKVEFQKNRLDQIGKKELSKLRKNIQVVFQDPYNSLSPRMSIKQIIGEGLEKHFPQLSHDHDSLIEKIISEVGLSKEMLHRYPHEFSGGERQRIAIARAIILKPELIILDEPTSALDRSVQYQVVELLKKLKEKYGLTYIFISHDLRIVRSICPSLIVMNNGEIVESGKTEEIFSAPECDYTKELLSASPGNLT